MSGPVIRASSDYASVTRKRALRELARERRPVFLALYRGYRRAGLSRDQARGRARTRLRETYPLRYSELLRDVTREDA